MDEPRKNDDQVNLLKLVKELTVTQATLAKINAQLAMRQAKDQVKDIIATTGDNLKKQADQCKVDLKRFEEEYKKNSESRSGILEDYKKVLDDVNSQYESVLATILDKKAQLEADEQDAILEQHETKSDLKEDKKQLSIQEKKLKDEIMKATKEGDLETAQEKISELRNLVENSPVDKLQVQYEGLDVIRTELRKEIEACEKQFDKISEERKIVLDKIKEGRNVKLAEIPKQSFLQKMIGLVANRFNKTKTFMRTAIDPLKEKITTIKEEDLPRIKKEVDDKKKDISEKIVSKRRQIEEKAAARREQRAEKLSQAKQKFMETLSDIKNFAVDKVVDVKENIGEKVDTAKEFAGQVKDDIIVKKDAMVQDAKNLVNSVVEGAKNVKEGVTTHVTSAVSSVKSSFRSAIDKGYQMKIDLINKAQAELDKKREEITAKRETLNQSKEVQGESGR